MGVALPAVKGSITSAGQDAVDLVLRGNSQHHSRRERLAEALVIEKVEEPVLEDRSAEVSAELVAVEARLGEAEGAGLGFVIAEGIEIGVAQKLVERGVELVGAAAGGNVDGRAGGAAILRAFVVGNHLELGDGVRRGLDDLVVEALIALAVGIVVHAVQQIVVEHAALAVDVVCAGADQAGDGGGGGGSGRLARTGDQSQQIGVIAAHQREGFGLVPGNRLPAFTGFSFDLQGNVADLNGGGAGLAHGQGEVDVLTSAHRDRDIFGDGRGKIRRSSLYGIHASAERRSFIVADSVCVDPRGDSGAGVGNRDGGIGHGCAAGVVDGADQTAIFILRARQNTRKCNQQAKEKKGTANVHHACESTKVSSAYCELNLNRA